MHILAIHQLFNSSAQAGSTRHYELFSHVVACGHEITVITSDLTYLSGEVATKEEEFPKGLTILRIKTPRVLHKGFLWRVYAFLYFTWFAFWKGLFVSRVDLVWGTSPPIFQTLSAYLVALCRWRPFVFEVRDLWPDFAISMKVLKNPLLIVVAKIYEKMSYRLANRIIINSPGFQKHLIAKGVPAEKLSLIPNGVLVDDFCGVSLEAESLSATFMESWDLAGKYVVVYTGAMGPANDLITLLEAAEKLKSNEKIRFVLIGGGKEVSALEKIAAEKKLTNLLFVSPLSKDQMPAALAIADLCVATLLPIPLFDTTYPNKVFDYMAAAKPTLLGIDGVIREVVEVAEAGLFVEPGNSSLLAKKIEFFYKHPEAGKEMGQKGRAYVREHFDRRLQGEKLVALLSEFQKEKS
ncbi:MAG: glycosyltransferase family 4 protein [Pirellulaceae bacterium]|nr:glycosyltransferase family 4 protein [Pirellulaceae bacterium]